MARLLAHVLNVMASNEFEMQRSLAKIGKPIDKTEWHMTPPTVNAYYSPNRNEIVFPAGILQPPFFDAKADDAVNYGGIGAVIGHEMTHGFDDQGRQYDADGNLKNWWTDADLKRFKERSDAIVKQFDEYVAIDELRVIGSLTQGENIADLGGLKIAYDALEMALARKPAEERQRKIDG
ncbi:MAG: M13 family metallopeptidase, partial [Verrucomicrobiota bacterium]